MKTDKIEQDNLPATEPESSSPQTNTYKIERYKFILQELRALNDNVHKFLTLFQTLTTAIIGAGVGVFVSWQKLSISAEIAAVGIRSLLGLLLILAIFVIVSLLATIFSWMDYRKEEVALLNETIGSGHRQPPTFRNFWRWQETYLILFTFITILTIYIYTESKIIPLIQ